MNRKKIPQNSQANVLLWSRRRCCMCFGLNRDTSIKQGQIAHLDGKPSNNAKENLAFLCFEHHDQYDSTTRLSKKFTHLEVKQFRKELYKSINLAFSSDVLFGEASANLDAVAGHYIRDGEFESAEIRVNLLADGKYHITGLALWGKSRMYGPNLGELDFIGELEEDKIVYTLVHGDRVQYEATLLFSKGGLNVTEINFPGIYGLNVNFSGKYTKTT